MALRCWAGDTRLNGRRFEDALLATGDRLTIGPIELEVLPSEVLLPQQPPSEALPEDAGRDRTGPGQQEQVSPLKSEMQTVGDSTQPSASSKHAEPTGRDAHGNRRRFKRLTRTVKRLRRQLSTAREKLERTASDGDSDRQRMLDLQRQIEAYSSRESLWHSEQEKLRVAQDTFDQQRAAWATENARTQAELDDNRNQLASEREESARLLQEIERQRQQASAHLHAQVAQIEREQQDWRIQRTAEESRMRAEAAELENRSHTLRETENQCAARAQAMTAAHEEAQFQLETAHQLWEQERAGWESQLADERTYCVLRKSELDAQARAISQSEAQLARREALLVDDDVERNELETLRKEHAAQREAFSAEQAAWNARQQAAQNELDANGAQLEATTAQLAAAGRQHDETQARLAAREQQLSSQERRLSERTVQLESLDETQHSRQVQLDAEVAQLAKSRQAVDESQAELHSREESLRHAEQNLAGRCSAFEATLAEFDERRLALERASREVAEQMELIKRREEQLISERASMALVQQSWEEQQHAAKRELEQREIELKQRVAEVPEQNEAPREGDLPAIDQATLAALSELEAGRAQLARDRQAWEESHARFDERYRQQLEQIESQVADLRSREAAHEEKLATFAQSKAEQERQAAELEALRHDIEQQSQALSDERRRMSARFDEERAELERERESMRVDPQTMEDAAEVRQMLSEDFGAEAEMVDVEAESACDENADVGQVEEQNEAAAENHQSAAARGGSIGESSSDDQSIEDYMAALFGRYGVNKESKAETPSPAKSHKQRRKSDAAHATSSAPEALSPRADAAAPSREAEGTDSASKPVIDLPTVPFELERRAPVETADLAAMRALANTHATIAITTHGKKRFSRRALTAWSAAIVCLATTWAVFRYVPEEASAPRTGAMIGVVAGIYWIMAALTATQQLIVTDRKHRKGLRVGLETAPVDPTAKESAN